MTDKILSQHLPKGMILGFPPVREIFFKNIKEFNDPEFVEKLPDIITFNLLINEFGIDETVCINAAKDKAEFDIEIRKIHEQEAAEFGVPFNLDDAKHQWSNHKEEVQEACVSRIEEIYAGRQNEIIFYGPSNIQMWYSLEEDMLPYRAQNHGMGGCIDPEMIKYAPRMLYAFEPTVVFFQTGSNDLALGIPIETILENKKKMYDLFLENMPNTKLVVMAGLPLPGRTEFWDDTVKTNELLKKMCDETDRMYFMDATDDLLSASGPDELKTPDGRYFSPQYYRSDKIHLNKPGHDVWTKHMKKMLEEILP